MPVYKEWNIGDDGLAAIWKIEEAEEFFREQTGIGSDIKSDKRRIEHLAGRYLLKHLQADFPLHDIKSDDHGKPRTEGDAFHFSISHSWPYVAAAISPDEAVGIDIQVWHPRIEKIQHKYLSTEEQEMIGADPKMLTLAWSVKEAVYKWHGKKGVEFIEELPISFWGRRDNDLEIDIYFTLSKVPKMITINSLINPDFACAYVNNVQDWAIY